MVKLSRGGMNSGPRGRQKPRPLFPPGELPLFGPPPAYMRRPVPPPPPMPPPGRGGPPMNYDYHPPRPPMRPPPHMGHPMPPPPPPMPMRRRLGPPPPPMPLLQAPIPPPRPLAFMRGRGPPLKPLGRMGFAKRMGKMIKNRKNRNKPNMKKPNNGKQDEAGKKEGETEDVTKGPWINDAIKLEIDKMNEFQKAAEEKKTDEDTKAYNEQKEKVQLMSQAAKLEYVKNQPKQEEHYCETCDRGWETIEELAVHQEEHVQCEVAGCVFSAAPKVVALHFKLQHLTGVFERIVKTSNKEDIDKWREERKRHFPTTENIERKKLQLAAMEERGERTNLTPKDKPNFRNRKRIPSSKADDNSTQKTDLRARGNQQRVRKRKWNQDKKKHGENGFLSTAGLSGEDMKEPCPGEDENFSDEEWKEEAGCSANVSVSSVLSALTEAYGSDSEGEDESKPPMKKPYLSANISQKATQYTHTLDSDKEHKEEGASKESASIKKPPVDDKIAEKVHNEEDTPVDEDEGPPEEAVVREADDRPNVHIERVGRPPKMNRVIEGRRQRQGDKQRGEQQQRWGNTSRNNTSSLIEKLLAAEIRQERNHILQCLRYIVQKDFFQEKPKPTQDAHLPKPEIVLSSG